MLRTYLMRWTPAAAGLALIATSYLVATAGSVRAGWSFLSMDVLYAAGFFVAATGLRDVGSASGRVRLASGLVLPPVPLLLELVVFNAFTSGAPPMAMLARVAAAWAASASGILWWWQGERYAALAAIGLRASFLMGSAALVTLVWPLIIRGVYPSWAITSLPLYVAGALLVATMLRVPAPSDATA